MKLDSKYFDMIRASRARAGEQRTERTGPRCQWNGCEHKGDFRAPKGRGREGEFLLFCEEHVREYNANYNYFDGMSDREVADFQKDALTGHRPTWQVGANSWAHGKRQGRTAAEEERFSQGRADAQRFRAWRAKQAREAPPETRRKLKPLEKKALSTLELKEGTSREEIKTRFKELVKRHHPDLNGGDRGSEDKLREIISAYNYLKQAGLV